MRVNQARGERRAIPAEETARAEVLGPRGERDMDHFSGLRACWSEEGVDEGVKRGRRGRLEPDTARGSPDSIIPQTNGSCGFYFPNPVGLSSPSSLHCTATSLVQAAIVSLLDY